MIESGRPRRRRTHPAALALLAALVGLTGCAGDAPPTDDTAPALPQLPASPVDTAPAGASGDVEVTVYFTRNELPVGVPRRVPATRAPLGAALGELLAGPSAEERAAGLTSWFSEETAGMLLGVSIGDDGHAVVDFADFSEAMPNASTSAGSGMLLNELNHTVFQFDNVRSVEYRFEGDCARFFEWLQHSCERIERPA